MNKLLSQCRTELMGIGAMGVLVVHSLLIVEMGTIPTILAGFGGLGVYIFVFLSGLGLVNSLEKTNVSGGVLDPSIADE